MTTSAIDHRTQTSTARTAYLVTSVVAGVGFVFVALLSAFDAYELLPPKGHVYGVHVTGAAGVLSRLADHVSYFTEWSNLVVAVAFGVAALRPHPATKAKRALLLSSLVMITVTAIVYRLLLAPTAHVTGWSVLTNPWQHIVVPVLAVVVFLVWGPRGWARADVLLLALVIPVAWLVWAFVRGQVVGSYPYGFLDPSAHGWGSVLTTVGGILVFGVVLALVYWGLDRAVLAQQRRRGGR